MARPIRRHDVVTVTDNVADRDGIDTLDAYRAAAVCRPILSARAGAQRRPGRPARPFATPTPTDGRPADGLDRRRDRCRQCQREQSDRRDHRLDLLHWQFETDPGTGVFEDIILLPAGDLAFQSANGTTFRVTPDLAGLSLRVKAIYQDAHGVDRNSVLGCRPQPVDRRPRAPPSRPSPCRNRRRWRGPQYGPFGPQLHPRPDQDCRGACRREDILSLLPNVRAPLGLRTVDGSFNNLLNFGGMIRPIRRGRQPLPARDDPSSIRRRR